MNENLIVKLLEHTNWAKVQIIQACSELSDEQLDAEPHSATRGNIRQTLMHLVSSQRNYFSLLTLPLEERKKQNQPLTFDVLKQSAIASGGGLLELLKDEPKFPGTRLETTDGYDVEPWVVVVQIINHATEHREQINSMRSALGLTPLDQDGWSYGEFTNALIPIEK